MRWIVTSTAYPLFALLMAARVASAQTAPQRTPRPDLITDRPDFTESSEVIPLRWLQFESGVSMETDGPGVLHTRSISAPAALLRVGLGFRTELRLGAEGYVTERTDSGRTSGYSDIELGAKVRLLHEATAGFDLSVIPMLSFPTGKAGFSSEGVDPTIKVTWGRELPAAFWLGGNVNFAWLTEQGARFSQQALSFSLNREIGAGWNGYAEIYGFSKMTRSEGAGITVNGGVSRAFGGRVQIDVEAGRGITSEAPDWFVGAGFAVLWSAWAR